MTAFFLVQHKIVLILYLSRRALEILKRGDACTGTESTLSAIPRTGLHIFREVNGQVVRETFIGTNRHSLVKGEQNGSGAGR
jgi:hypothetical protein